MHWKHRAGAVRAALIAAAIAAAVAPTPAPGQSTPPGTPGTASANVWTFSLDTANNLVIQDLESLAAAEGQTGQALCLRFYPACPSSSERKSAGMRQALPRYTLRSSGGRDKDWRIDMGQVRIRDTGTMQPLQVGVQEQGMVQIVTSPGPWALDLQRIPAAELRVGDGKRWNVFLTYSGGSSDTSAGICWIEVSCQR